MGTAVKLQSEAQVSCNSNSSLQFISTMAEVETPKTAPDTTETKETTAATGKIESPTKLKEAMKETEKKAENGDKEVPAKEAVEALNLLAQGKRNMLCGEVPQAVTQLQEACRLLASKFGDTADECGEAYLSYGTALLDLSRMESGVLGNALDGIDSEDDDKPSPDEDEEKMTAEEKEKLSDEIIDAMTEERPNPNEKKENGEAKTNGESKTNGEVKTNGHAETNGDAKKDTEEPMETESKKPDSGDDKSEASAATSAESEDIADEDGEEEAEGTEEEGSAEEGEASADSADESKPGTSKEKEEEDVSNLQLAWEILELAKIIYTRHESKEMKLKAAECHLKLGEVGLETEQYETSIRDFEKCLELQMAHLEAESRLIAETHYQIGLASCFAQTSDKSLKHLRSAVEVIRNKIKKLEDLIAEDEKPENKDKERNAFDDPIPGAKKEVADLKEILPDILAKIEDTEDEKKSQEKVKQMVKENLAGSSSTTEASSSFDAPSSSSEAKPVNDISSMVRKKRNLSDRKPEEEAQDDAKKAKTEENGSGDAKAVEASS